MDANIMRNKFLKEIDRSDYKHSKNYPRSYSTSLWTIFGTDLRGK